MLLKGAALDARLLLRQWKRATPLPPPPPALTLVATQAAHSSGGIKKYRGHVTLGLIDYFKQRPRQKYIFCVGLLRRHAN